MILLIDNYDSFTYNVYQYIGELNKDIRVIRNDECDLETIRSLKAERIVISPGPRTPNEAGICVDVIRAFGNDVPILGICLGHQCIGKAYGGRISYAKRQMHGKKSEIRHFGDVLFKGIPTTFKAARYHSLTILEDDFPQELTITARETEEGEIMAVRHKIYPVFGLQFHPESVYTEVGREIIANFLNFTL